MYMYGTCIRYKGTVRLHAKVHTTEYIYMYMYATVQCTEKVISCFPDWRVSEYRAVTVEWWSCSHHLEMCRSLERREPVVGGFSLRFGRTTDSFSKGSRVERRKKGEGLRKMRLRFSLLGYVRLMNIYTRRTADTWGIFPWSVGVGTCVGKS